MVTYHRSHRSQLVQLLGGGLVLARPRPHACKTRMNHKSHSLLGLVVEWLWMQVGSFGIGRSCRSHRSLEIYVRHILRKWWKYGKIPP
jgi:hypothetical protein